MESAHIAQLLAPFLAEPLTSVDPVYISTYIDILLRWNARMNLTAIRNPEEIVIRHFGESLFVARHLFPGGKLGVPHVSPLSRDVGSLPDQTESAVRLADVGSGAGFPGIPIKLWMPELSVTLIESNQKKSVFLREVARALTLTDIDIQNVRAETLPKNSFDVVTHRAVEHFAKVLPLTSSLVSLGGRLALLISDAQLVQTKSCLPGWQLDDPVAVPLSRSRSLTIARRVEPASTK